MTHDEILNLIRGGVTPGTWADFGAGSGSFTRALRQLIGTESVIYAIDQDARSLETLRRNPGGNGTLRLITADFTHPLDLPPLDGILMANALHFVPDQPAMLTRLKSYLRPGGRLLLVEYDISNPTRFVPYPVPFTRFETLALAAGFSTVEKIGERKSPSNGMTMVAATSHNV